jgi:adenylate cyclase
VSKVRHIVVDHDLTWEIDVFEGTNAGLIIAEVELKKINQNIRLPDWVGHEMSGGARFSNSHLAKRPYWAFETSLDDIEASLIGE